MAMRSDSLPLKDPNANLCKKIVKSVPLKHPLITEQHTNKN